MTPRKFAQVVAAVDVSRMPWRMTVGSDYDHARMRAIVVVSIRAVHRDSSLIASFASAESIGPRRLKRMETMDVVRLVWRMVRRAVLHEAAENFLAGGCRVYDPHRYDGVPRDVRRLLERKRTPSPTPGKVAG